MKIAYPVTDYIRASLLTTEGDMVVRRAANIERLARGASPTALRSTTAVGYPAWSNIDAVVGRYLRSVGVGFFPAFSALALSDTGIHIASTIRNNAGNQIITGIGFESSVIIFLAIDGTTANMNWSVGFDNNAAPFCIASMISLTDMILSNAESIIVYRDGANSLVGHVTAIGADGFTITWTLVGACSANFIYLCLP